jgi:DNA-binding XRE family transcriptional regulator
MSKEENTQIILKDGVPEWVVVPYEQYRRLVADAEMLQDIQDYDEAVIAIDAGEEELVPGEVVYALLDGENPIMVWRRFRGLTQEQLAAVVGISKPYLSQLETGKRRGTTAVLGRLAQSLDLSIDDLIPGPADS